MPAPGKALPGATAPSRRPPIIRQRSRAERALSWGPRDRLFGMGCFWGAERKFWELGDGVYVTAVGYAAGQTPNPTYEEVCSGRLGTTSCLVVYDRARISYEQLLKTFWENHDPTQGMRQGNDVGTQYRSGIYVYAPNNAKPRERQKPPSRRRSRPRATARLRPRSSTPRNFILPRIITSSTSPRTRWAIAASAVSVSLPIGTEVAAH